MCALEELGDGTEMCALTTSVTLISGSASIGAVKKPFRIHLASHWPLDLQYGLTGQNWTQQAVIEVSYPHITVACYRQHSFTAGRSSDTHHDAQHRNDIGNPLAILHGKRLPKQQPISRKQEQIPRSLIEGADGNARLFRQWDQDGVHDGARNSREESVSIAHISFEAITV